MKLNTKRTEIVEESERISLIGRAYLHGFLDGLHGFPEPPNPEESESPMEQSEALTEAPDPLIDKKWLAATARSLRTLASSLNESPDNYVIQQVMNFLQNAKDLTNKESYEFLLDHMRTQYPRLRDLGL
jgi:hypothetical protein